MVEDASAGFDSANAPMEERWLFPAQRPRDQDRYVVIAFSTSQMMMQYASATIEPKRPGVRGL